MLECQLRRHIEEEHNLQKQLQDADTSRRVHQEESQKLARVIWRHLPSVFNHLTKVTPHFTTILLQNSYMVEQKYYAVQFWNA